MELGNFDLLVGNMECCIVGDRADDRVKEHPFAVKGEMMRALRECGVDALNLANNHILDCGAKSLRETMSHADGAGIRHFGAGMDRREASSVREIKHDGYRVALIGACDRSAYYAGRNSAGVMPLGRKLLGRRVREAKRSADLVAVCLHADLEFVRSPAPWRIRLCRWLVDQGAHLVICHHPHVVQGIEEYRGGVIAYSLGNFIFRIRGNIYQEKRADTDWGMLLGIDVTFDPGGVRLRPEFSPVRITHEHRPRPPEGRERDLLMEMIEQRNAILRDPVAVRREWRAVCWREARREMLAGYYSMRRGKLREEVRTLQAILADREKRRWVAGLLSGGYL